MDTWSAVRHLFERDDLSSGFPDIWLEGVADEDVSRITRWLVNKCGRAELVSVGFRGKAAALHDVRHPEKPFGDGRYDDFSLCLQGLVFDGVDLADLRLVVEEDSMALDYSKGEHWNENRFAALLALLRELRTLAPHVRFSHADEGFRHRPNPEFAAAIARALERDA